MIVYEIRNPFNSIYQYKDLHYHMFEKTVDFFKLTKLNTYLHSSCAYTNIGLELAEKYGDYYDKYIIEEPMIDFHQVINRSIKQIRFITPLLSKKLYPDCLSRKYKIKNPVLLINSSNDKITNFKDCIRLLKQIECDNITCKFVNVTFKEDLKINKTLKYSIRFRGAHANLFRSEDYYKTLRKFILK